ncbi:hypothetical protein ACVR1G_08935 [Streptococcus dentasini]
MLKLIYYQFSYSKKQWLSILPLFFASSLLVGICLVIAFNVREHHQVFNKVGTPAPIFVGPIIFGGVTLLFLISGLIKLLLQFFKEDYRLWVVNGASRIQLSFLISGQLTLLASLTSAIGGSCAIFCARWYYSYVQTLVGKEMLPTIPIAFNGLSFLLTVIILATVAFLGGFIHSYRILNKNALLGDSFDSSKGKLPKIARLSCLLISLVLWLTLAWPFLSITSKTRLSERLLMQIDSSILLILALHIIILNLMSPYIQVRLTKWLLGWSSSYNAVLAKWTILQDRDYLKSLTSSIAIMASLISQFMILSDVAYSNFSSEAGKAETMAVLLFFVAGPLIVALANILSITILSSINEYQTVKQWATLGISHKQAMLIRFTQSLAYGGVTLVTTLIFNMVFFYLMRKEALLLNYEEIKYSNIYLYAVAITVMMFVFVFVTKAIADLRNQGKTVK